MKAYNKSRKRKIQNSNYTITIVLENCEAFIIPSQYIRRIEKRNGNIKLLEISKEYINTINKHFIYWDLYDGDIEKICERIKTSRDITRIIINHKEYYIKYIDEKLEYLYSNNVLQSTKETEKGIVYEWDLDKRIIERCIDYGVSELTIHKSYKNKVEGYKKITFYN